MPVNSSSQFQLTGTEPNNNGITYTNSSIQSSILTPSIGGNTASVTPTGLVQWNTTGATIGQEWFMTVVLTGTNNVKSEIDFIIKITNGGPQNPICLVNGNSNNTIISGSPFSINVSATDPEGQALTITNTTLPSGMGSSISGNSITYNWTPLPTHAGTYTINTTFTDPTNLTTSCAFNMTVIEKKVVSCYEFASNTNDSKGINNGTAIGGSYVTDRFGAASSAYLLNGSSSYVSIPTTNLTNANYSYSAWIKPYSYPTAAIILSIGNTGADQAPGIYGTNMALTSYSHA